MNRRHFCVGHKQYIQGIEYILTTENVLVFTYHRYHDPFQCVENETHLSETKLKFISIDWFLMRKLNEPFAMNNKSTFFLITADNTSECFVDFSQIKMVDKTIEFGLMESGQIGKRGLSEHFKFQSTKTD